LVIVLVLAGVSAWRADRVFINKQPRPAANVGRVDLDHLAALGHFSEALMIPTVSYDDRDNFDAGAFLAFQEFLRTAYPLVNERATRTVVNGYSVVYALSGSDPSLQPVLFLSHMDVVPVEDITLDEWTYPPFSGTIADGMIWGRGSVDDKIGVVALMEAMERLLEQGVQPRRSIYLAFGHDEEVSGHDGAAKVAEYFEQQGLRFEFVLDEGGAVTEGLLTAVDRPVAIIGVSEKGYVNLRLTVNAPGGHSSQPPPHTALGILAQAIVNVEDSPFPAHLDPIVQTFDAIGAFTPYSTRFVMGNLWLFSPLVKMAMLADQNQAPGIHTTTAATMASASPKANILPTRAEAVINFRILPGETVESVKDRVVGLIDDKRVEVSDEYGVDPSPVSPTDTWGYQLIASTIRGFDDKVLVAPYMVRGGTDSRFYYPVSPNVYRFLMIRVDPETMHYVHGIDEHLPIEDFLQAIRFYYSLLQRAGSS